MSANYEVVEVIEEGVYWVQEQAPAGNWVDYTGFPTFEAAVDYGQYANSRGRNCRIITKTISILEVA